MASHPNAPVGRGAEEAIAGLLAQAERATDRAQRAATLKHAAQIYESHLRDAPRAYAVWQAAFANDLCDAQSAEALERLAEHLRAGRALIAEFRPMVASAPSARAQASLLGWLGRWLARFTEDFGRAERYLVEALRIDPSCAMAARTLRVLASHAGAFEALADTPPPSTARPPRIPQAALTLPTLEPLGPDADPPAARARPVRAPAAGEASLEALVAAGRWPEAVSALKTMASKAAPPLRAKYLATAGKILHHKLNQDQAAVQLLDQALDAQPGELRVFERQYQILAGHRAWREAEVSVGRMIQRIESVEIGNKVQTLEALWRRLGDVYRLGLGDLVSAAKAYKMCARLAPHSQWYPRMLAEIAATNAR